MDGSDSSTNALPLECLGVLTPYLSLSAAGSSSSSGSGGGGCDEEQFRAAVRVVRPLLSLLSPQDLIAALQAPLTTPTSVNPLHNSNNDHGSSSSYADGGGGCVGGLTRNGESELMGGLVRGLEDSRVDTRKAAVLAFVEVYACVGDACVPILRQHLSDPQMKLLTIYIGRRRGGREVR
mmetsp:Transcript_10694/g.19741  ORF Transcript_10694/g.19741 Transcript_10694/m.19741 type:complete len:179 (-) Transcript_10694:241-777(-)